MRVAADASWWPELARLNASAASAEDAAAPDLAIGGLPELPRLLTREPRSILVEGDGRRVLHRAGYRVSTYVALSSPDRLRLVLAAEHREAAAYGVRTRIVPASSLKRLRRDVAARLLERGIVPPRLPLVTVGQRHLAPPFLVAAAQEELGIQHLGWFLVPGAGDALSRGAFFLFPPRETLPSWALKFPRVRGYDAPFRREEQALRRARAVGPIVERHAPEQLAQLDVGGFAASIESAAPGSRLDSILSGPGDRRAKVALVERVAEWVVELAAASRAPAERLGPEWRRLVELAARAEHALGVPIPLPEAPFFEPVLQHNDLGAWNVVVGDDGFVVVDWESSERYGAPLWDLLYFLVHVLSQLAGSRQDNLDQYLRRLLRGEDEWSRLLFRWTRRAAADLGIPSSRIGTLATLCWLHHSKSRPRREAALADFGAGGDALALLTERLPVVWFDDDGLGPSWPALEG